MRRQLMVSLFSLTALSAIAVAAKAQDAPRRTRSADGNTFTFTMRGDSGSIRMFDSRRGRIGITVALAPDRSRDSVGAYIEAVADAGPAQRAGVRAGDVIVRWNDVRLADGRGDDDEFRSRPGQRLMNLAQRLEPGDTVRLDVRRESRQQQFTIVADSADMDRIVERIRMPMMMREFGDGPMLPRVGPMAGAMEPGMRVMAFAGHNLSDLELVKVGPQLAEGLGVSEGLLVVDIDSGSALGLRAGDVIVTIGGRRATTPGQAMRILSTYEVSETVQFEVMRQRRRQTVNGRMPEGRARRWRVTPNSWEMELPRMPMEIEPLMRHQDELHMRMPQMRRELEDHLRSMPKIRMSVET